MTLTVQISPESPRTILPIIIDMTGIQAEPSVNVKPATNGPQTVVPFPVPIRPYASGYRGEFWLENAGSYDVSISAGPEHLTKNILVQQQEFLTFEKEIAVFSLLFIVMAAFIYWGYRASTRSSR